MDPLLLPSRALFLSSPLLHLPRRTPNSCSRCCVAPHSQSESDSEPESERSTIPIPIPIPILRLVQLSATLTVVHSSLLAPSASAARVSDKKHKHKHKHKEQRGALSMDELRSWCDGLPEVSDRVPYAEIIALMEEGKLRHIVKLPGNNSSSGRSRSDPVLVVLHDDSRVLKSLLPTIHSDAEFWAHWDTLGLDALCLNAYTPPLHPFTAPRSFLARLTHIPLHFLRFLNFAGPNNKSHRARADLAARRRAEADLIRHENEALEQRIKAQAKEQARNKRLMERRFKVKHSLVKAEFKSLLMSDTWNQLATDNNVPIFVGFLIFFIFYNTVVLSYKKQQSDYEDRMKLEKAEAEERRKMQQLDSEIEGRQGEEGEQEQGEEKNPYLKVAMRFMRSGARIRRRASRNPLYLDKGADVKFTDVAGLGNIRVELEEIVKFFTMAEVYQRRGVKVPSKLCSSF